MNKFTLIILVLGITIVSLTHSDAATKSGGCEGSEDLAEWVFMEAKSSSQSDEKENKRTLQLKTREKNTIISSSSSSLSSSSSSLGSALSEQKKVDPLTQLANAYEDAVQSGNEKLITKWKQFLSDECQRINRQEDKDGLWTLMREKDQKYYSEGTFSGICETYLPYRSHVIKLLLFDYFDSFTSILQSVIIHEAFKAAAENAWLDIIKKIIGNVKMRNILDYLDVQLGISSAAHYGCLAVVQFLIESKELQTVRFEGLSHIRDCDGICAYLGVIQSSDYMDSKSPEDRQQCMETTFYLLSHAIESNLLGTGFGLNFLLYRSAEREDWEIVAFIITNERTRPLLDLDDKCIERTLLAAFKSLHVQNVQSINLLLQLIGKKKFQEILEQDSMLDCILSCSHDIPRAKQIFALYLRYCMFVDNSESPIVFVGDVIGKRLKRGLHTLFRKKKKFEESINQWKSNPLQQTLKQQSESNLAKVIKQIELINILQHELLVKREAGIKKLGDL